MRKKRVEKEFYEKVCSVCGTPFIAKHGNKRICPECVEVLHGNKGRHLPRQYETPGDLEQYEVTKSEIHRRTKLARINEERKRYK